MNILEIKVNSTSTESQILETFQQYNNKNHKKLILQYDVHSSLGSQLMKIIQEQLQLFSTLEDLIIIISQQCILDEQNYFTLGNALSQLQALKALSIQIGDSCLVNSECISGLSFGIKKLTSLIDLEVKIKEYNDFGEVGCKSLRESIECLSHLKKLSIQIGKKCQVYSQSISNIFECIKQSVNLCELKLSVDVTMLNESSIVQLSESIYPLQNLTSLELVFEVEGYNFTNLHLIFKSIKSLKYIKKFKFGISNYQSISQEDMYQISSDLSQLISIEELSITNLFDNLSQECSLELFKSLSKMEKLISLILSLKNIQEINEESSYQIGNYLKNLKNLKIFSLIVSRKFIYQDQFIYELIDSLQVMKQLKSLSLCFSSKICATDCLRFFYILQEFKDLNDLYIDINEHFDIRKESIEQFAQSLKSLTNLNEFNLNCYQSVNFSPIMLSLQNLKQLRNLTLSIHQICSDNIPLNLGISLQNISQLQSANIYLSFTETFDEQTLLHIYKGLKNQNELKILKLDTNQYEEVVNEEIIQSFFEVFKCCNKLQEIYIKLNHQLNIQITQQFEEVLLNLKELEQVEFTFQYRASISELTKILYGIQSKKLKKLTLFISTIIDYYDFEMHQSDTNYLNILNHFINLEYLHINISNAEKNSKMKIHKIFVNSIQNLKSLKSLDINFEYQLLINNDMFEAFRICFEQLKNLQKLKLQLYIKDNKITTQGVNNFYNGLLSLKSLKDIELIIYSNHTSVKQLLDLIHNFENVSQVIMSLNQGFNQQIESTQDEQSENQEIIEQMQLQSQNSQQDSASISKLQQLYVVVNLNENIQKIIMQNFFQNLKFFKFLKNFTIDLVANQITLSEEIQDFNNSLSYLINLQEIYFNFVSNKHMPFGVLYSFATSLTKLINLQRLNVIFDKDFLNNSDGICSIMKSFSSLKNLTYFNLDLLHEVGKQPVIIIGESISQLKELQQFYLRLRSVKEPMEEGVKSLGLGLLNTPQLKYLSLQLGDNVTVGDIGAISLGKGLSNLKKLIDVEIIIGNSTNITDSGCSEIFKSLSELKFLINLQLQFSQKSLATWQSTEQISQMLSKLKYVSYISIEIHINGKIGASPIQLFEFYDDQNLKKCQFTLLDYNGLICEYTSYQINFSLALKILFDSDIQLEMQPLLKTFECLPSQTKINFQFVARLKSQNYYDFSQKLQPLKSQDIQMIFSEYNFSEAQNILDIGNGLGSMENLQKLQIQINPLNQITSQVAVDLAKSLSKCSKISHLNLCIEQQQYFQYSDFFNLIPSFQNMKYLRDLQISSYSYLTSDSERLKLFQQILKKKKDLVVLKVNEQFNYQGE